MNRIGPEFFDEPIDRRAVPALKVHPRVLGDDGAGLFAAGVADMDFRAPPPVLEALQTRLDHGVFGYEAVPDDLFPALIDWQRRRHGWSLQPDRILRSPNILNAMAMAVSLFTGDGDGVIVQPPVFFDFFDIVRENRRRLVPNPLRLQDGRYEMDFDGLEQAASDPGTTMMFLCNPHNPVGRVWTAEELRTVGAICARHGVLVVADEMHADIVFPGSAYRPFASLGPEEAANSVTCLSPAKAFNIAACCSAFTIVADPDRRAAFQAMGSRYTVNKNNAFANVAMTAAYREGGPWLDGLTDYLYGNLTLVLRRVSDLNGVEAIAPEGTFLLWVDFRGLGLTPPELQDFLRTRAGWAVSRGVAFGEGGAGFARVNIACPRPRLDAALDRLAEAVRALRGTG